MPIDDRDRQFERALARHLPGASPDSACPDAEILAAYHERTLSLEELARWKEHIAGCTRCQESLALVEQTENLPAEEGERQNLLEAAGEFASPEPRRAAAAHLQPAEKVVSVVSEIATPAPIGTVRTRPPWRWIVPVGALAAGVIVWIGVREVRTQQIQQRESAQIAQSRPAPAPLPQSNYEALDQSKKTEPAVTPSPPPLPQLVSPQRAGTAGGVTAARPATNSLAINKQKDLEMASGGERVTALQTPPAASGYIAKSQSLNALTPPPASAPAPAAPAANQPAGRKKEEIPARVTQSVEVNSAAPALDSTSAQVVTIEGRDVADLLKLATVDRRYLVAPGEKLAWRLGDAGKIERSTDRGKNWKLQKSGVTVDLTAGSATSDKICWVVGKAGTVLLTTDAGKHWKLITSPITDDLGGVHATDARHASIWDVPNRKSFETSDGGATWTQSANE
jgi:hypothetical protein